MAADILRLDLHPGISPRGAFRDSVASLSTSLQWIIHCARVLNLCVGNALEGCSDGRCFDYYRSHMRPTLNHVEFYCRSLLICLQHIASHRSQTSFASPFSQSGLNTRYSSRGHIMTDPTYQCSLIITTRGFNNYPKVVILRPSEEVGETRGGIYIYGKARPARSRVTSY